MKLQHFVLIIILWSIALVSKGQNWDLAKDKNGVKVYTRKVDGWGIKEYKVTMNIKTSPSKIIAALKDVPGRYKWAYNSIEIREIERPNREEVAIYNKVDAPWPVADRDNITRFKFSYPSATLTRVDMTVIKSHAKAPVYEGIVRIERLKGHWLIRDKGNGWTEITQQCVAEPGGSLPDWLANSAVVDNPYNSMYNLKQYIENN
ncbi:MAG: Lipid-binding START domain-containing protein [uncultured Aureispira sp.]|uniref:Lipid-binding START domain-containing protein n=1 Tax=uncultured Aureispira sp. TaxID=1331704 RepID=A0A6S6SSB4_9BACT|nr:MAG: Lipid-binding START domain-containing protein [uncultured Aureispira sp.]